MSGKLGVHRFYGMDKVQLGWQSDPKDQAELDRTFGKALARLGMEAVVDVLPE